MKKTELKINLIGDTEWITIELERIVKLIRKGYTSGEGWNLDYA